VAAKCSSCYESILNRSVRKKWLASVIFVIFLDFFTPKSTLEVLTAPAAAPVLFFYSATAPFSTPCIEKFSNAQR
jgi:hypothetical protein